MSVISEDAIKNALCISNKKISFRQKGSVERKRANKSSSIGASGYVFYTKKGEVVEGALFERITRDCSGELIRASEVMRFRKIGSDEWVSFPVDSGRRYWDEDFVSAQVSEAIAQYSENKRGVLKTLNKVGFDSEDVVIDDVAVIKESEEKREEILPSVDSGINKKRLVIGFALLAVAGFVGYKIFYKK